jgi:hypothetical protein
MSRLVDTDGGDPQRPLVVDLDGTLIATDTLWECLVALLRKRPWDVARSPLWLVGGRASFKRRVAERVTLDASTLPYREELIAFLQEERGRGRAVYLATACDERIAGPIAAHTALFDGVLASDGTRNLAGRHKARRGGESCDDCALCAIPRGSSQPTGRGGATCCAPCDRSNGPRTCWSSCRWP